jgi:hypothetical protein
MPPPMLPLLLLAAAVSAAPVEVSVPASTAAFRGVHLTGWAAGSAPKRRELIAHLKEGGFNAAVIALKDYDGHIFVKGVKLGERTQSYVNAIPDLPRLVADFKEAGLTPVARIAVFKDDHLARARPDLAVHFPDGSIWTNDKGTAWVDPYQEEVWDYVIDIASHAAAAGFPEIQFDFIRFPSDGKTRQCRYKRADHSAMTSGAALLAFLDRASSRLRPLGVKLSIDTFGLTTSVDNGMGIGQHLSDMAKAMDYVSPMMYPSHYAPGEYGLADPNKHPYIVIRRGIQDALQRMGGRPEALRPFLQDFSMHHVRYNPAKVRAQIHAAEELGVTGWILWNAQNKYSWDAPQAGPMEREELPAKPKAPRPASPPQTSTTTSAAQDEDAFPVTPSTSTTRPENP